MAGKLVDSNNLIIQIIETEGKNLLGNLPRITQEIYGVNGN